MSATYTYKLIAVFAEEHELDSVIHLTNSQHTGKQWAREALLHGEPNADYVELWAINELTREEHWMDTFFAKAGDDKISSAMEPVQYVDTEDNVLWYNKEAGGMI